MELRVLRYFLAIAREGSITNAAAFLHVTQPTLSRQIKDLESELGKRLFIRGSHSMTLTAEGMLLRKRAEEIISMVDKTESEFSSMEGVVGGDIYIGGGETRAVRLVAEVAGELREDYPGIRYHLFSGNSEDVTERLDKGLLDFGILIEPADISKYDYIGIPAKDTWGVIMRKDSPPAQKKAVAREDLIGVPLLLSRQAILAERGDNAYMDGVGKQIASCDGIILEIGAGPGGGYMPYILKANPDATVIISDLSPTVVREWKLFLDKSLDSPNIYYAAFDFCNMPFKDNSIDIISDGGGIGNCEGIKAKALKEAFRVLKPGGKLITSTGFVNKETLAALPEEAQKVLTQKRPDVFEDLYEDTVPAGFSKIDSVISGCWYTDDDESTIADLARSLGVNLKFTSYTRYCTKEQ